VRTNKVNKEEIVGMLVALELFLKRDHAACGRNGRDAASASRRPWSRSKCPDEMFVPKWPMRAASASELGLQRSRRASVEVVRQLREVNPALKSSRRREILVIGVWMMQPGEDRIVGDRIRAILTAFSERTSKPTIALIRPAPRRSWGRGKGRWPWR